MQNVIKNEMMCVYVWNVRVAISTSLLLLLLEGSKRKGKEIVAICVQEKSERNTRKRERYTPKEDHHSQEGRTVGPRGNRQQQEEGKKNHKQETAGQVSPSISLTF